MAKIGCPECGATLSSANVDLGTGLAKCECGNTFDFRAQPTASATPLGSPKHMSPPEGMTSEADGAGALTITCRWMQPYAYFFLFINILWGYVDGLWVREAWMGANLETLLFLLGHGALGVGLTYYTFAFFLNRTIVRVSGDQVTFTHTPLRWMGARTLSIAGAERLHVRSTTHWGRRWGPRKTWTVLVDTDRSASIPLIEGLREDQALFVASQIAAHRGLV